jgi:hypothetical protein
MIISEISDAMVTVIQSSDNQRNMSWREFILSKTYDITRADEGTDMQHNSGQK